jgi:hypothetical protein
VWPLAGSTKAYRAGKLNVSTCFYIASHMQTQLHIFYRWLFKCILALLCTTAIPLTAAAQIAQEQMPVVLDGQRLEMPRTDDEELPEIVLLGEEGLLYFQQTKDRVAKNQNRWVFSHYDTTFTKVWEETYLISNGLHYIEKYKTQEHVYLLFEKENHTDFSIFKINAQQGGDIEVFSVFSPVRLNLQYYVVTGQDMYLAGDMDRRPVVIHFSMNTLKTRVLPTIYNHNSEISDIVVDPFNGDVHITVADVRKRKKKLFVKTFRPGGVLVKDRELEWTKERPLLTARVIPNGPMGLTVLGTYAEKSAEYPQGFYLASLDNYSNQKEYQFQKFTDYNNFFNHLKPSRRDRIKRRIFKKREKGKELQVRYRFLLHEIQPVGENFLVVAEAYYPQYRDQASSGMFYGSVGNQRMFDGYRFTHTLICMIDKKGRTLWHNSVAMDESVSFRLNQQVEVQANADSVAIFFSQDKQVGGRVLENGVLKDDKLSFNFKPGHENSRRSSVYTQNLVFEKWYGMTFIAWGTQTNSSNFVSTMRTSIRRNYFFMHKFRPEANENKGATSHHIR